MLLLFLFVVVALLIAYVAYRLMGETVAIITFLVLVILIVILAVGSSDTSSLHCC